jgi:hypothetical protein
MASLSNAEYESRKQLLTDLKILSKTEALKMFEILKKDKVEYSENSNGVFFDLTKVSAEVFEELNAYMEFCRKVRLEQSMRDEDERIAQENLC